MQLEQVGNWVRALSGEEFWIGSLAATAIALAAFYGVFRFVHRIRVLEDTPTSKLRSAAQGYVELVGEGQLMPGEPIRAPLTGTICTWYDFKVEKKVVRRDSKGRTNTSWETVRSGTSGEIFQLRDETGECAVDPEGATVICEATDVWYGATSDWHGAPPAKTKWIQVDDYRFTESRMHPGDPLYAIGLFRTVSAAAEAPDLREETRELLNSWKRDPAVMARFDTNGDGQVDLAEWEVAQRQARSEVERLRGERMAAPAVNLLSKPTEGRQPFILSVLPQEQITRRFRWMAGGSLLAFCLGGSVAVYMFVTRFA